MYWWISCKCRWIRLTSISPCRQWCYRCTLLLISLMVASFLVQYPDCTTGSEVLSFWVYVGERKPTTIISSLLLGITWTVRTDTKVDLFPHVKCRPTLPSTLAMNMGQVHRHSQASVWVSAIRDTGQMKYPEDVRSPLQTRELASNRRRQNHKIKSTSWSRIIAALRSSHGLYEVQILVPSSSRGGSAWISKPRTKVVKDTVNDCKASSLVLFTIYSYGCTGFSANKHFRAQCCRPKR